MKFGDHVRVQVRNGPVDYGYIIGVPTYSEGYDDVVVVANAKADGMPVNVCHCQLAFDQMDASEWAATRLRERYESKYPNALAAQGETDSTKSAGGTHE